MHELLSESENLMQSGVYILSSHLIQVYYSLLYCRFIMYTVYDFIVDYNE